MGREDEGSGSMRQGIRRGLFQEHFQQVSYEFDLPRPTRRRIARERARRQWREEMMHGSN